MNTYNMIQSTSGDSFPLPKMAGGILFWNTFPEQFFRLNNSHWNKQFKITLQGMLEIYLNISLYLICVIHNPLNVIGLEDLTNLKERETMSSPSVCDPVLEPFFRLPQESRSEYRIYPFLEQLYRWISAHNFVSTFVETNWFITLHRLDSHPNIYLTDQGDDQCEWSVRRYDIKTV